jgi:hypothetical protein
MDPNDMEALRAIGPAIAVFPIALVIGWVLTTWMRIKNGYPLNGRWGQSLYPKANSEEMERIRLLTSENVQLRAELGSIKDRLANVERIVTDDSHRLSSEIESLRGPSN